jgi:hypothetical protein
MRGTRRKQRREKKRRTIRRRRYPSRRRKTRRKRRRTRKKRGGAEHGTFEDVIDKVFTSITKYDNTRIEGLKPALKKKMTKLREDYIMGGFGPEDDMWFLDNLYEIYELDQQAFQWAKQTSPGRRRIKNIDFGLNVIHLYFSENKPLEPLTWRRLTWKFPSSRTSEENVVASRTAAAAERDKLNLEIKAQTYFINSLKKLPVAKEKMDSASFERRWPRPPFSQRAGAWCECSQQEARAQRKKKTAHTVPLQQVASRGNVIRVTNRSQAAIQPKKYKKFKVKTMKRSPFGTFYTT